MARPPGRVVGEVWQDRVWNGFRSPLLATLSAVAALVCLAASLRALFQPWLLSLMGSAFICHFVACYCSTVAPRTPQQARSLRLWAAVSSLTGWFFRMQVYLMWYMEAPMSSMASSSYSNGSGNIAEVFTNGIEQVHALMLLPPSLVAPLLLVHMGLLYSALRSDGLQPPLLLSLIWSAAQVAMPRLLLAYLQRYAPPQTRASRTRERLPKHFMEYMGKLNDAAQSRPPPMACCSFDEAEAKRRVGCTVTHQPRRPCQGKSLDWPGSMLPPHAPSSTLTTPKVQGQGPLPAPAKDTTASSSNPPAADELLALGLTDARLAADELGCGSATPSTPPAWALSDVSCSALNPQDSSKQAGAAGKQTKLWGLGGPVDRMAVLLLQQQAGQGSVAAALAAAEEAVAVESTAAGGVMGHGPLPPVSDGSVEAGHPVTEDVKGKEEEAKVEEERAKVEEERARVEEEEKAKVEVEEEKAVKAGTLVEDDRVVEDELSLLNLAFPVAGATPAEHDVDAAAMAEGQCFTGYLSTGSPVEACSAAASSSSLTDLVQQPHSSSWQAASQGGGGVDPLTMAKGAAAPGTQQAVAAAAAAGMASGVRVVVVRPGLPTPHASSSSYGSGAVRALPGGSSVPGHGRASAHANSLASMAVAPAWDLAPNQRTLQALANVQMLARKMSGAQGYKSRLLERQVIMKLGANEPGHLGASVLDTSTNMLSSDRSARWVAARASVRHGCVLLCIDLVACLPDPPPAASPSPLPTLDPSSAMSTSFAPSPGSLAPDGVLAEGSSSSSRTARWPSSETGSASNRLAIAPPPSLNSLSDAPQLLLEAPDCTSPSNARGGEEGRPAHRAGTGLSGGAGEEGAEDGEDVAQGHTEVAWPAAAGGGAMGLGPSTLRNSNLPIDSVQLEAWLDALLVAGRQQPVGTQVFIQVGSCQVLATFTGAHPAWLLHPLPPSTLNMTIEGATQVIWRLPGPRPAPAAPPAWATTGPLSGPGGREDEEEEGVQAPSAAAPLAHLPVTLSLLLSHYGPVRFCGSDATSTLPPLLPLISGTGSQQAQAPGGGVALAGPEAVPQQLLRAEELDRAEPGAGAEVRAVGERNVEAEGEGLPREGEEEEVVVQVQARGSWGAGLPVMLLAASSAPGGEEGRWSTTLQLALPLALAPSPGNLFIELWHGPRRLTSLPLLLLPPRSDPHPPAPPPGSSSSGSSTTSTTMAPPSTPAQAPDLVTPSQDLDVANGSALLQLLLTSPPSTSPLSQGSQEGVAVADQGPAVDYQLLELVVTAADLLPPGADLIHGLGSGADGADTAVEAAAGPGAEVEVEAAGGSLAVVGAGAGAAVVAVTEPPGGEEGSPDAPAALEPGAGGVREGSAAWLADLGQLLHLAWYATHPAPGAKAAPRADTPLPPASTNHVPALPAALPPTPALVPAPAPVPAPAAADPLRLDWGGVVSGMARAARSDTQLVSSTLHMAEGLLEYAVGCGLMHTAGLIAAAMEELRRGAGLEREEEGRPRSPGPGPMAPGARSAAVAGSEGAGEDKGEEEQGEGAAVKGEGEHRGKHGRTLEVSAKRKGGDEEGMQGLGSKGGAAGAKDEFVFDSEGVQHTWAPSGTPAALISALTSASQTAVTADPSASYSAGSCSNTSSSSSNSNSSSSNSSSTTNCSSGSDATIPVSSSSSSSSRGGSGVWDLHPLRGPPHVPSVKTSSPSHLERPSQGGTPLPPSPTPPCRAPAPLPATSSSASTSPTLSAPFACPPRPPARGQANGSGCGSTHPAALLRAAVLGFSRPGQERAYSEWLGRRAAHTAQMWSVIYGMTVLCCAVRSVMHGTLAVELPMYVLVVLPYLMSWRLAARKQHRLYEASQVMHAVGRSILFMAAGKGWLVWPSTFSVGYRVHVDVWGEVLMHTPAEHVRLPALLLSRLLLACSAWSMTLLHHMETTPMQQVYRVVTPLVGSLLVGALLDCQRRNLFLSLRGKPQAVR